MTTTAEPQKKVFIRTHGCQMNVYDSERMADVLSGDYATTDAPDDADLILINTCHIREKASEKVFAELGLLRQFKERAAAAGRTVTIGVTGCVAQAEGEEIARRANTVDLVVGPQSYQRLPELVREARSGRRAPVEADFAAGEKFAALRQATPRQRGGVSAFLTAQEGCDKFCTFCIVPYTRGAEFSRSAEDLVAEATRRAGMGVRELTLLGQNVNAWHGEGPEGEAWGLGRLLFRLAEIPGIARLRYTTSHASDMDDALIAAHRDLPQLMPYLHLPVQAGSDRILHAMNRRHRVADYLRLVDRIRTARPDMALSGDFIVGFPGETEADFAETLRLVETVTYASAFTFKYSPRPGTPAASLDRQVPETEKNGRLYRLQALIAGQQAAFNRSRLGMEMDVLFDRPGKRPGQIAGRSPWLQTVHVVAPPEVIGTVRRVTIDALGTNTMSGFLSDARTFEEAV